jgi:ABC-type nitrate/sulfonate/bicarbonate transport system substrate-binding protein
MTNGKVSDSMFGKRWNPRTWPVALLAALLAVAVAACGEDSATGGGGGGKSSGDTVKIVAFQAPSLGAFLPAVIEQRKIDAKHDIDLQFTYTTPDNYNAEFAAGHYDVGGSAALLSEALRTERDVGVTYLFNLFDYFGAVVTDKPEVKQLTDLEGRSLAAATGTTNYAMFEWFAQQQGLDLEDAKTVNQTTPGLSTMAMTGRSDATELWEPAYSTLLSKKPDVRTLDMGLEAWQQKFKTESIPYLGVAAQQSWVDEHPEAVQKMYATYKEAADWVQQNPAEAAEIIAEGIPNGDPKVIQGLIEENERLGLAVAPASDVADGINAVFKAGQETGYLEKQPPKSVIYEGLDR